MKDVPVTIALSAYNVLDYVMASLDCILAQTFKDFELICIDDASTDGTWEILQEYAQRDSRVRLLRQDHNQGLSVSRNLAIQEAKGEYLLMLDGDDLFAPDMVEKAYTKAKETDADMVMWDYVVFYKEDEIAKLCKIPSELHHISPSDKKALLRRPAFTWVRLLKTEALRDLGIHFTQGLTKQDIPIHWKLVTSLEKISLIPERLSYYRQQIGSTSNRKGKSVYSLAYVMDIVKEQLLSDGIYDIYKNEFLRSRLSLLQGMYDFVLPELKNEAMEKVRERLGKDEMAYIKDPNNELSGRVRSFYGMIQGNRWATMKYKGVKMARAIYRMFKKS